MNLATVYFNRKSGRFNFGIIRVWCCISRPVGYSHKIFSHTVPISLSVVSYSPGRPNGWSLFCQGLVDTLKLSALACSHIQGEMDPAESMLLILILLTLTAMNIWRTCLLAKDARSAHLQTWLTWDSELWKEVSGIIYAEARARRK